MLESVLKAKGELQDVLAQTQKEAKDMFDRLARVSADFDNFKKRQTKEKSEAIKFANEGEGLWRRAWATKHNANLYPTHGLGPVANCLDINRGDRFEYLVSMSSLEAGLNAFAEKMGWPLKDLLMTVRVAVTGRSATPPIMAAVSDTTGARAGRGMPR